MVASRTLALAGGVILLAGALLFSLATSSSDPPTPSVPGHVTYLPGTPGERLSGYVDADFRGERLERAAWAIFKSQVMWPTEPAWDEAYIVRSTTIAMGPTKPDSADATTTYDTLGVLSLESFVYETSPSSQRVPFKLLNTGGTWKIGLPMLRPHPSPEAAIAYLERMGSYYTQKRAVINASIKAIQADAAQK